MSKRNKLSRRNLLKGFAAAGLGAAFGIPKAVRALGTTTAKAETKPRFLIVLGGFGGASIIDSFLAIRESESNNPLTINAFPDEQVTDVSGSPFRAVATSGSTIGALPFGFTADQNEFVNKHKQDMLVATATGTSVNHAVAQKRSLTGNGAWSGRTLQEAVAAQYGNGMLVPNVNMATLGFLERGDDQSVPDFALPEPVADPALWSLSLNGSRGIKAAPDDVLLNAARDLRDRKLDPESTFARTFGANPHIQRWLKQRALRPELESGELISKLNMLSNSADYPFAEYGLTPSEDAARLATAFPLMQSDPLEAQAALAFLLIKNRVSVSVTMAPTFSLVLTGEGAATELNNPPLAFDYSHNSHRATQAVMWKRTLSIADRLIALLKAEQFDATTGESFWDRSLIYVATDFGRSRNRQGGSAQFNSGHHLNNGNLIISPLVKGNTVLGGVNKDTGLTYGWKTSDGSPLVNEENGLQDIYAGILGALGVDTGGSGLANVPAMVKAS